MIDLIDLRLDLDDRQKLRCMRSLIWQTDPTCHVQWKVWKGGTASIRHPACARFQIIKS